MRALSVLVHVPQPSRYVALYNAGDTEHAFTVKAADLKTAYTDDDMEIQLKVTGTGALKDKLWVTTWIESETGVIWTGADLKYTG